MTARRFSLFALLVVTTLVAAPARAEDDSFSDHYERAQAFTQTSEHAAALHELEAAYALRQLPKLLREMALCHRRLGHTKEALDYDRRYLTADPSLEPAVKSEILGEIAELRALEEPAVASRLDLVRPSDGRLMVPVHYEMRSHGGLISGGASLLATGCTAAFISGVIFAALSSSGDSSNGSISAAGGTLLIPVAGPFISALVYRQAFWSLPWVFVDGAAQVAGLAMIIVGARTKHRVPVLGDKLSFAPYAGSSGGGLVASGQF